MKNKTENLIQNLKERNMETTATNAKKWWQNIKAPKNSSQILLGILGAAAVVGAGITYQYMRTKS